MLQSARSKLALVRRVAKISMSDVAGMLGSVHSNASFFNFRIRKSEIKTLSPTSAIA